MLKIALKTHVKCISIVCVNFAGRKSIYVLSV